VVTVVLRGGEKRSTRMEHPFGHPRNPARLPDGEAKLRQCAEFAARPFGEPQLAALCGGVRRLEELPSLGPLLDALIVDEGGAEGVAS
jgi:hypothetical protein